MPKIDIDKLKFEKHVIPNDLQLVRENIVTPILSEATTKGYNSEDQFAIRLSLEEAISNSYKHGNHCDLSKHIYVRWAFGDDCVVIFVSDDGVGFDSASVPDPRKKENREKPSGRGVMLMRAYMTDVTYNSKGNQVCLIKVKTISSLASAG